MHIVIVGGGDVGFQLGKRLSRDNHDITLIERDAAKVRRAAEQLDAMVIEGTGDSYQVLKQAGIHRAGVVAAVTDNDDANLMACRIAKAAGVEVTIARVRNPEFSSPDFILTPNELGADHIIHPEREAANAIVRLLQESSATHVIDLENGRIEVFGRESRKREAALLADVFFVSEDPWAPALTALAPAMAPTADRSWATCWAMTVRC